MTTKNFLVKNHKKKNTEELEEEELERKKEIGQIRFAHLSRTTGVNKFRIFILISYQLENIRPFSMTA